MKVSLLLILLLLACDGSRFNAPAAKAESVAPPVVVKSSFTSARTAFDKKRVCAEEGKRYFDGLKLKDGKLPDQELNVTGPLFAYNPTLDTCLCEYFVSSSNLATHEGYDAGYIDDIFQNGLVAQFHIDRHSDGTTFSSGLMSKEAFNKRERELMGFY